MPLQAEDVRRAKCGVSCIGKPLGTGTRHEPEVLSGLWPRWRLLRWSATRVVLQPDGRGFHLEACPAPVPRSAYLVFLAIAACGIGAAFLMQASDLVGQLLALSLGAAGLSGVAASACLGRRLSARIADGTVEVVEKSWLGLSTVRWQDDLAAYRGLHALLYHWKENFQSHYAGTPRGIERQENYGISSNHT